MKKKNYFIPLQLFMTSNPRLQSTILDLLCQLLILKVNYNLLDSNQVFLNFIFQQLESIEVDRVRNVEYGIENTLRFLFLVNNKLVSIPKLINITDTLLANCSITKCGIRALVQLSYEIFLTESHLDQPAESATSKIQLNTEKEFVFSILMKFLQHSEVQKIVYIIILKESENRQNYEASFVENIFELIEKQFEGQLMCLDVQDLEEIIQILSTESLMKYKHKFVDLLKKMEDRKLDYKTIKLMQVIYSHVIVLPNAEHEEDHLPLGFLVLNKCLKYGLDQSDDVLEQEILLLVELISSNPQEVCDIAGFQTFSRLLMETRHYNCDMFMKIFETLMINEKNVNHLVNDLNPTSKLDNEIAGKVFKIMRKSSLTNPNVKAILSHNFSVLFQHDTRHIFNKESYEYILEETTKFLDRNKLEAIDWNTNALNLLKLISNETDLVPKVVEILTNYFASNKNPSLKYKSRKVLKTILQNNYAENSFKSEINEEIVSNILSQLDETGLELNHFEEKSNDFVQVERDLKIDEFWFANEVENYLRSNKFLEPVTTLLLDYKSEKKLSSIVKANYFQNNHILTSIRVSFRCLKQSFQRDCILYKPHIDYLKVPILLKFCKQKLTQNLNEYLMGLENSEAKLFESQNLMKEYIDLITDYLDNIQCLEEIVLQFLELRLWDKFYQEQLLDSQLIELMLRFSNEISVYIHEIPPENNLTIESCINCLTLIVNNKYVFTKWNSSMNLNQHAMIYKSIVTKLSKVLKHHLYDSQFVKNNKAPETVFEVAESNPDALQFYQDVMFLSFLKEIEGKLDTTATNVLIKPTLKLTTLLMRFDLVYTMAVTPHELFKTLQTKVAVNEISSCPIPMVSIDFLKIPEILRIYVAKVNSVGFVTRHHFEEHIMSLMVLVNSEFSTDELGKITKCLLLV